MKYGKAFILTFFIFLIAFGIQGCNKINKPKKKFDTKPVSIKQFDTPAGADLSVSAEMGGENFSGEGWETKKDYNIPGDKNAIKGGSLVMSLSEFPVTLISEGKDANNSFWELTNDLLYESLLRIDPVTMDYTPGIASHWKISEDKTTFKFRINPNARWADGKPVTSDDVIATWKLLTDPGILMPYANTLWNSYEKPVAESKYIISVKSKEKDWRLFFYYSQSLRILPAHYISNISGKEYLDKFQFEFIPGSGPYIVSKDEIKKGESITVRRRSDYWAEKERFNTGINNFDLIRFDVIQDESLELEKFKKGDLDVIWVRKTLTWEEKLNTEEVKRGLIQKIKVFNEYPGGLSGICLNSRKYPFDDIRIRKAFGYLYNREKFNEKLFFNAYVPISSYFSGTIYENKDNPKLGFNIDSAIILLSEAGWKDKNSDGYLIKDGKYLEIDLPFLKGMDRYFTIYQEDLKKAGIKLNLRESDYNTVFKMGNELNFKALPINWTGTFIPNPESYLSSENADSSNTLNWSGIKDKRIDELCNSFKISFDQIERIKILKEIDYIACNYFGYVFGWYSPYQRIAFQNKFGYPKGIISRIGGYGTIINLWYNDPEKCAEYDAAITDKNKILPFDNVESKYWLEKKAEDSNKY
ncbi:MAG TPA: ABC transporter substrate-binding protein [Ignavibacteria bacterium]